VDGDDRSVGARRCGEAVSGGAGARWRRGVALARVAGRESREAGYRLRVSGRGSR
jgi:glycine cleavage system aminomethyltransferase T